MQTFLHVGCGHKRKDQTTSGFAKENWKELRFDINESVEPDYIGTMTDMSAVETSSMDEVYSSHNIEHLYAHEVPKALAEFKRVLRPNGFVIITCPDIQAICALSVFLKITNRSSRIVCNSPRWNQSGDQLLPILRILFSALMGVLIPYFEKSIFKISGKARSIKQWRSQYL